jgi:hypothetical protein
LINDQLETAGGNWGGEFGQNEYLFGLVVVDDESDEEMTKIIICVEGYLR